MKLEVVRTQVWRLGVWFQIKMWIIYINLKRLLKKWKVSVKNIVFCEISWIIMSLRPVVLLLIKFITTWASMFNEATFREILPPSLKKHHPWWEKCLSKRGFLKNNCSSLVNLLYNKHWTDKWKYFYGLCFYILKFKFKKQIYWVVDVNWHAFYYYNITVFISIEYYICLSLPAFSEQ